MVRESSCFYLIPSWLYSDLVSSRCSLKVSTFNRKTPWPSSVPAYGCQDRLFLSQDHGCHILWFLSTALPVPLQSSSQCLFLLYNLQFLELAKPCIWILFYTILSFLCNFILFYDFNYHLISSDRTIQCVNDGLENYSP